MWTKCKQTQCLILADRAVLRKVGGVYVTCMADADKGQSLSSNAGMDLWIKFARCFCFAFSLLNLSWQIPTKKTIHNIWHRIKIITWQFKTELKKCELSLNTLLGGIKLHWDDCQLYVPQTHGHDSTVPVFDSHLPRKQELLHFFVCSCFFLCEAHELLGEKESSWSPDTNTLTQPPPCRQLSFVSISTELCISSTWVSNITSLPATPHSRQRQQTPICSVTFNRRTLTHDMTRDPVNHVLKIWIYK